MPDFVGSLIVFSVVISMFLFAWSSVQSNQNQFEFEEELRQDALYTTTFMVSTEGYPQGWNNSTVEIPGFVNGSDNVLSDQKLEEFRNVSYERQKALLGVKNFRLSFRNQSGIIKLNSEDLDYGQKPSEDASTVIPVRRNVLINRSGKLVGAEMEYVVWR